MKNSNRLFAVVFLLALAGLFVVGVTFGQHVVERKIRGNLNRQIAKHADDMTITYKSVKANFLARKVSVNGIAFTPLTKNPNSETLLIDRLEVSDLDTDTIVNMVINPGRKTIPKSMRVGLNGMHFTAEMLGQKAKPMFEDLQIQELNVSLAMGLKIDRDAKTFRLDELGMEVADLGRLSTTWDFSRIEFPTDEELENPAQLKEKYATKWKTAALHYGDIKYTDLGFIKRIDQMNQKKGKPSLAQAMDDVSKMMGRGPAKLNFINDAIPKVQDFLKNGGTIAITAKPEHDQSFVELTNPLSFMDPNAFATQIGLSVEVSH